MIFFISAIRHVITGGLLVLFALFKLPEELRSQVEAAADWTAPIIAAFIAWFILKYGALLLKKVGYVQLIVFTTAGLGAGMLTSCSHVDAIVDTTGATATVPDEDGDGIPDEIVVASEKVTPIVNDQGINALNERLSELVIEATK